MRSFHLKKADIGALAMKVSYVRKADEQRGTIRKHTIAPLFQMTRRRHKRVLLRRQVALLHWHEARANVSTRDYLLNKRLRKYRISF